MKSVRMGLLTKNIYLHWAFLHLLHSIITARYYYSLQNLFLWLHFDFFHTLVEVTYFNTYFNTFVKSLKSKLFE